MRAVLYGKRLGISTVRLIFVSLLCLLLVVAIYIYLPTLIYQNLGWRDYAESKLVSRASSLTQARHNFARSLAWNQQNARAWRGQALVAASQQDIDLAQKSWARAELLPQQILDFGKLFVDQGDVVAALYTYQSARLLDPKVESPAFYAASGICQGTWPDLSTYPPEFGKICRQILAENGQNLLFNHQFTAGVGEAWRGQFFFSSGTRSQMLWDKMEGQPAPSGVLIGKTDEPHFGIYQIVCLPPGTTVRYSGWFRIEAVGQFSARLLYIGWRQHDRPQGNHAQVIEDDIGWTYVERQFTLPDDALSRVDFYPANISGQGIVWIDNFRVDVLSQPSVPQNGERFCR